MATNDGSQADYEGDCDCQHGYLTCRRFKEEPDAEDASGSLPVGEEREKQFADKRDAPRANGIVAHLGHRHAT
jgi:hypothetical protein